MRDRLFSGPDVEGALAAAASSLGLPQAELRYVVLDAGGPGGRGLQARPAQIAVLLQEPGPAAVEREHPEPSPAPRPEWTDVRLGVERLIGAVARAGDLALACELEDTEEALLVHLQGNDSAFFFGPDGKGEPLRALEHLLQRTFGEPLRPRVLRLRCPGFRERRDQALAEEALRLAAEVRADGRPRTLEPMNAYERRIVHLALQQEPDLTTHSVGEGLERRVRIAPREGGGATDVPPGGAAAGGDSDGL